MVIQKIRPRLSIFCFTQAGYLNPLLLYSLTFNNNNNNNNNNNTATVINDVA